VLGFDPHPLSGESHRAHTTVANERTAFDQPGPLETVDDSRRGRGITSPLTGERSHASRRRGVEGAKGAAIAGTQVELIQDMISLRGCRNDETEQPAPRLSGLVGFRAQAVVGARWSNRTPGLCPDSAIGLVHPTAITRSLKINR